MAQSIPEPVPGTWPPSGEALGSPSTVASTCEQVGRGSGPSGPRNVGNRDCAVMVFIYFIGVLSIRRFSQDDQDAASG